MAPSMSLTLTRCTPFNLATLPCHCADPRSTLQLQFLKQTDVLSIHVPLSASSRGLIGERELALLPPGSHVINTARGPVLDTQALISALKSGHLAGAGLDVFDQETSAGIDPWLLASDRVTLTPHFACNISSIYPSVESEQAENLRAWAVGEPVNVCNRWD
jgi:phosphoglycerate dehydrogenase-like enzyme